MTLPLFAFGAVTAFALVPIVDPSAAFAMTSAVTVEQQRAAEDAAFEASAGQSFTASEAGDTTEIDRGTYKVKAPVVKKVVIAATAAPAGGGSAPAAGNPDPDSAQAIAKKMVADRGWGSNQYDCLVALWNKESHWNMYASNAGSGAYGIPQALPGSKMASAGSDWKTNPATQIEWGLGYISGRYGNPCGAWSHSQSVGWY